MANFYTRYLHCNSSDLNEVMNTQNFNLCLLAILVG
jgi:hypothetical protein